LTSARFAALGNQLIDIHIQLREQLARLREGSALPRDLRVHCLAFCATLTRHHTGEDTGAFALLAREAPQLRPVLEELQRDHQAVAEILSRVQELAGTRTDPHLIRAELDGLAALLESHFTYEERKITAALNGLPADAGSAADLLGFG
jgi:iron-sulfur cluster repair protein YtfE (RIC family)